MPLVHLDRRLKGWLIGSLVVLGINLIVFIFRSHFNQYLVLGVVFLTPVAWTALYFLSRLICRKN
jgi:hypothetical protein